MKAVLMSIQPKWCELIANGKKTVEVRKTKPKLDTPFKVYIYCTNSKKVLWILRNNERNSNKIASIFTAKDVGGATKANGKVIGEFMCYSIDEYRRYPLTTFEGTPFREQYISKAKLAKTCLSIGEVNDYLKGKTAYLWHISNLVIYDEPKELSEFSRHDNSYNNAFGWAFEDRAKSTPITRPPQSWCYIEVV